MSLQIALLDLDTLPKERKTLLAMAERLPFGSDEYRRLCGIRNPSVLAESLGGLLALQAALQESGQAPTALCRTPQGKPYFDSATLPCLSITHTVRLAAALLADTPSVSVGIDAQAIRPALPYADIAKRFFSAEEQRRFAADGNTEDAFYRLWTQKEALAKLCGTGLFAEVPPITAHLASFWLTWGDTRYCLSVASESGIEDLQWYYEIKELTIDDIQN